MTTLIPREVAHNDVWRRIGFTLFALFLYRLLYSIPLPSIDYQALRELLSQYEATSALSDHRFSRVSILSLGLMPYVSAYVLVEILSLFVPPLKKLRTGDFAGRSRLKTYALLLAVILGGIHAYGIVEGLSAMKAERGLPVLPLHGPSDYILPVATLMAGVFILIFLAEMISRYGVAHGISTLIAAGTMHMFADQVWRGYWTNMELGLMSPGSYLLSAIAPILVVVIVSTLFLKSRRPVLFKHPLLPHPVGHFNLNMVPSGIKGIDWGFSIVSSLWLAESLTGTVRLTWIFLDSQPIFGILLGFPLAVFFLHWRRRTKKLANRGWTLCDEPGNSIVRKIMAYNVPWALFVAGMFLLSEILLRQTDGLLHFYGISFLVVTAAVLDVWDRIRKSRHGSMTRVAEIHDVYDATMIKNHLEAEGIRTHLQGFHHRSLLYFFGPYVEISVLVQEEDREKAEEVIEKFYGGIGLVRGRIPAPEGTA